MCERDVSEFRKRDINNNNNNNNNNNVGATDASLLSTVSLEERVFGAGITGGRITGLEAFTLDLRVSWPMSLVLSRRALTKYQLLFR